MWMAGRQSWIQFSRLRFREGKRQEQEAMSAISARIRRPQDPLFDDLRLAYLVLS